MKLHYGKIKVVRTNDNNFVQVQVALTFGKLVWATVTTPFGFTSDIEIGYNVVVLEDKSKYVCIGAVLIKQYSEDDDRKRVARIGDTVNVSSITHVGTITSASDNVKVK